MNCFSNRNVRIFLLVFLPLIVCSLSCTKKPVASLKKCTIYYYKDEAPWVPDWFMDGTVESMLHETALEVYDSAAINMLKNEIDSLLHTLIIGTSKIPDCKSLNVRYLVVFDYGTYQDTLAMEPVAYCPMKMNNTLFYSKKTYYDVIKIISSYDPEWGRLFNRYHRDSTFYYFDISD